MTSKQQQHRQRPDPTAAARRKSAPAPVAESVPCPGGGVKLSLRQAALLQLQQSLGNAQARQRVGEPAGAADVLQREDVRQAQEALLAAGYSLGRHGADGLYGPATERAVRRFQKERDLPETGLLDKATRAALRQTAPEPATPENKPDVLPPAVHLGMRAMGRAYMLDWQKKHKQIAQDGTLREAFQANLATQIATVFGQPLTQQEVLTRIRTADKLGNSALADQLRRKLRIANQYAVIMTLEVETSERYQKVERTKIEKGKEVKKTATFCNIYAYDVVTALGGYLPRVWWTKPALARIENGEKVTPAYNKTVEEVNANRLTEWMSTHGEQFGWRREQDISAAQAAANQSKLVIILAANTNPKRSGHVNVLMPETDQHKALRDNAGQVSRPLQSQAGSTNFEIGTHRNRWWKDKQHKDGAAWIFEGKPNTPLLTPEQLGAKQ